MSKARKARLFRDFYSRQIVMKELGEKGQKKLARSRVAVVGLGGLGTVSSLYLALAGVGHLRLIDQDVVELRNLHRQILYTIGDLDYPKVEISAKKLRKSNPLVKVEPVSENLNASNVERLLDGVDCVVDGLDNMSTRYLVNRACVKLGVPYVFGAAIGLEGNLSVFAPPETPCLECVFPNVENGSLLTCDARGVLGATPGIIGAMQAMETVKVLTGIGSSLKGRLMICDFSDMYFAIIDVLSRSGCAACQRDVGASDGKKRLVWLCGQDTVNVNPEKTLKIDLSQAYELARRRFKVRMRSQFAVMFDYEGYGISLFGDGRMLIRNVDDERLALRVYREVVRELGLG